MIRALALAASLLASAPASANSDVEKVQGAIHASMTMLVCGITVPEPISREFRQLAYRYGIDPMRLAEEVARAAHENTSYMTAIQKDAYCYSAIANYRRLGLLR